MAYRQEEYVAEMVEDSGVLKGRQPWRRDLNAPGFDLAERLHENLATSHATAG